MPHSTARRTRRWIIRGTSLVETAVVVSLLVLLLAQAMPALSRWRQDQQLQLIAEALAVDLQLARSEAAQRGETLRVHFGLQEAGSCYLLHGGNAGQCRCEAGGQPSCDEDEHLIKHQWLPASQARLHSNRLNIQFEGRQGTASPATIELRSPDGQRSVRHKISILGRIRSCSPEGLGGLPRRCD